MKKFLDKKIVLRTGRELRYIIIVEFEGIEQMLFMTDFCIVMYLFLEDNMNVIKLKILKF